MYKNKDIYKLDFTCVKSYFDAHEIIKETFDFPDYYGKNWDAFWDCLTDMAGMLVHIEILGLDIFEKVMGAENTQIMISTLKDFKHYNNDKHCDKIIVEIVSGETRVILT